MESTQEIWGTITKTLGRAGGSGGLTLVKVDLGNGRSIIRAVAGPVDEGDELGMIECDREHRMRK